MERIRLAFPEDALYLTCDDVGTLAGEAAERAGFNFYSISGRGPLTGASHGRLVTWCIDKKDKKEGPLRE